MKGATVEKKVWNAARHGTRLRYSTNFLHAAFPCYICHSTLLLSSSTCGHVKGMKCFSVPSTLKMFPAGICCAALMCAPNQRQTEARVHCSVIEFQVDEGQQDGLPKLIGMKEWEKGMQCKQVNLGRFSVLCTVICCSGMLCLTVWLLLTQQQQ